MPHFVCEVRLPEVRRSNGEKIMLDQTGSQVLATGYRRVDKMKGSIVAQMVLPKRSLYRYLFAVKSVLPVLVPTLAPVPVE